MTLLSSLIDDTAGSSVGLAELLRRVRILSSRAGVPDIGVWAKCEAEGYDDVDDVPSYRGPLPTQVFVDFTGPYGSSIRRVPIAVENMPKDMRAEAERHFNNYVMHGVGEIESQVASMAESGERELVGPWNASVVALINHKIESGEITWRPMHNVETIYRTVTAYALTGVLESVRSRLLDLLLAIDEAAPPRGVSTSVDALPPAAEVRQIFHTVVMDGGTAAIGINPTVVRHVAEAIPGRVIEAIEAQAEAESDAEEAGFLRKVANWVGGAGRDILVDVTAEVVKKQITGPG
ncbi:hypothetical protein [Oryzobacter terrae]|uniref:AbiTii domain-containing protein n=1 Tax=Oryzobacter terrae TaxID=1620385 RepID=UPI00366CE40B